MKLFNLFFLLNVFSIIVSGQTQDTIRINNDTTEFKTVNPFLINEKNYETLNNSFITGNSRVIIRSQDNPKILLDGIPVNPMLFNNIHYNDFLGSMHFLSYDLQKVNINNFHINEKIVSGKYNNAISFQTPDIILGNASSKFETNNFTALTYQNFRELGYATVFNFNAQQSFKKFGYRFSLNNGFQNDYIPDNGIQRYGGNIKLKYQPLEQISLTGFIDYTDFHDFKRSGENNHKSNRLFYYLNTDIILTKWLTFHGKYGLNSVADISKRELDMDEMLWNKTQYLEYFTDKNNYEYNSTYFDIGFNFSKEVLNTFLFNLNVGYYQNSVDYYRESEFYYQYPNDDYYSIAISNPKDKEKVWSTSASLSNKYISFRYLYNRTNYSFSYLYNKPSDDYGMIEFKKDENKNFNNHLLSLNIDLIKNNTENLNNIGFQLTYGKLTNYSIFAIPFSLNPSHDYNGPDWTTKFENDNLQFDLNSSFLRNRIYANFTMYRKNYKEFKRLFLFGDTSYFPDIGKVTKSGYEINSSFLIVQRKDSDWRLDLYYSSNASRLMQNDDLLIEIPDTVIYNKIISLVNNFRYKNIKLSLEFEGKSGYDINLYDNNISVAQPLSYREYSQVVAVSDEGIPVYEVIENSDEYITHTDYLILKHIGLYYQIKDTKSRKYTIGLQYNKMRRIYPYVNSTYMLWDQFQRPSFYNSFSLSFSMIF